MWLSLAFACVSGQVEIYEFARKMVFELIKEDFLEQSLKPFTASHFHSWIPQIQPPSDSAAQGWLMRSEPSVRSQNTSAARQGAGEGGLPSAAFRMTHMFLQRPLWVLLLIWRARAVMETERSKANTPCHTNTLTMLPGHQQQRVQFMEHWKEQGQHAVITPHTDHAAGPGPSAAVSSLSHRLF